MLETLGSGLKNAFKRIAGLGTVDKAAVEAVVREVQRALLTADADVAMVAALSERVKKQALSQPPPGMTVKEHFLKILYDELVAFLGKDEGKIELKPQKILLVGLFGSGKSTQAAKLAKWFKSRGLSVGLVACDTHRPAAIEQLRQLGKQVGVPVHADGKSPEAIAKAALSAKEQVLIFDTAGRNALDSELAAELKELGRIVKPDEVLLVIPADIGQVAKQQATEFNKLVGITGIIVTKLDGTAKAGGALAAAAVSGAHITFIGVGEKLEDLEPYSPTRFVSRLIGYGDIQGLLEKAKQAGLTEAGAKKLVSEEYTLESFAEQLDSMQKMGSLSKLTEMLPGMPKLPEGTLQGQQEKMKKWKHIIKSMTPAERSEPDVIRGSRIARIAKGSGCSESEVRQLLQYYKQSEKVMKLAAGGKGLRRGPLAQLMKQFGMKG